MQTESNQTSVRTNSLAGQYAARNAYIRKLHADGKLTCDEMIEAVREKGFPMGVGKIIAVWESCKEANVETVKKQKPSFMGRSLVVRRLAQETNDTFDTIMAKVRAIYPGSSPRRIAKLLEDARKPGAKPWNQEKDRAKKTSGWKPTGGRSAFIHNLKAKGVSKDEAFEKTNEAFPGGGKVWFDQTWNIAERNASVSEEMTDASPLAEWLKKARIAKGLSIPDLAILSGLTPPSIYRIEDGVTRNLRETTRKKLEAALGSRLSADAAHEVAQESQVPGLGRFEDFDPYSDAERPTGPGIYVLYDISERPVYVGEGSNVRNRIADHEEKFWFKKPIIESASWIRIEDAILRRQIETLLIKFLKSNAIINKQNVERTL